MTSLMTDNVNANLLGMSKVISDDSARRALQKIDENRGIRWLQDSLYYCYSPCSASHGFWIPMSPSSLSTESRKERLSVTTLTSLAVLRIPSILI